MAAETFPDHRTAALALLSSGSPLNPKQGQFLGGIAFTQTPISEKQDAWLRSLLSKHGLPALTEEAAR